MGPDYCKYSQGQKDSEKLDGNQYLYQQCQKHPTKGAGQMGISLQCIKTSLKYKTKLDGHCITTPDISTQPLPVE